jgi:hypothetical protein
MVTVDLVKEIPNRGIVVKITSPVINGAWQFNAGPGAFHEELQNQYPHLSIQYCYDREWHIHYVPTDESMTEISNLVARVAQEEAVFLLQKIQYLSDHLIPDLQNPEPQK